MIIRTDVSINTPLKIISPYTHAFANAGWNQHNNTNRGSRGFRDDSSGFRDDNSGFRDDSNGFRDDSSAHEARVGITYNLHLHEGY